MDSSFLAQSTATITMMIVTVAVSLAAFTNQELWRYLALEPYRMAKSHQYHPIVTAGMIHADLMHLLINMLTLFFFGPWLEGLVGGTLFVVIYGSSLVIGNLYPFVKYRRQEDYIAIGASGAVSGILFSYCLFEPMAVIRWMFIPMPAFIFAILYVVYSVYSMRNRHDNIGHEAHLAGAFGGVLTTIIAMPEVLEKLWGSLG